MLNAAKLKNYIGELKKLRPDLSDERVEWVAKNAIPTWDKTKWVGILQQKLDKLNFPRLTQKNAPAPTAGQGTAYLLKRLQEGMSTKQIKQSFAYKIVEARISEAALKPDHDFFQDFTNTLELKYAVNCRELYHWMLKKYKPIQELPGIEAVIEYLRVNFPSFDKPQVVYIRKVLCEIGFKKNGLPAKLKAHDITPSIKG